MQTATVRSLRAIGLGTIAIVAGSLMMTTIIGVAAIGGMLAGGDSPEEIATRLSNSLDLAIFVRLAEGLMCTIGGYSAARLADRSPLWHAFAAGALASLLNLSISTACGDVAPIWLTVVNVSLATPFSVFGGWLAMPGAVRNIAAVRH